VWLCCCCCSTSRLQDMVMSRWHYRADFTSLIPKGNHIYTITHFESPEPAASYFTKSTQDSETGKLSVVSTECALVLTS
jgi:hypothetical protein